MATFTGTRNANSAQIAERQVVSFGAPIYGKEIVSGTKYRGNKRGLASTTESDVVQKNLENQLAVYAEDGYTFVMLDKDGKPRKNATINISGRVFKSRNDGTFHIVDSGYLAHIEKQREEHDEYIKSVMRKAVSSDEAGAHILGLSKEFFRKICAPKGIRSLPGGDAIYEKVFGSSWDEIGAESDLDKFNCTPSFMHVLNENSTVFAGAVSKLRAIIEAFNPIMEDMQDPQPEKAKPQLANNEAIEYRTSTATRRGEGAAAVAAAAAPGGRVQ